MSDARELDVFLAESQRRVDRYLDEQLPAASEPPVTLHEAMRYAVFSGGKRLRPALAFGGALAAGKDAACALAVAGAVELVHAYSLVHDDLPAMDDDDERRGRPTVHVRFGEAVAILAGDALLAEAFAVLGRAGAASRVVERLARAAGSRELVGGQVDDLAFASGSPTLDAIASIHRRKTAALFRFSVWGGAVLAGLDERALEALDCFGHAYGLAFQAVDDLLDADTEECSLLRVLDPAAARAHVSARIAEASAALGGFGPDAWVLRGLADRLRERLP